VKQAWHEFAIQRKAYQAEFQMLCQPLELRNHTVILHLTNPVQETMLDTVRRDLTTFLRNRLHNRLLQVKGELQEHDKPQVPYTSREKIEYLTGKNPHVKELISRLGLDPDY
jgi:hypothetical protein